MEPEKVADRLDDLADPTRVAILRGIRHAGEPSPRGLADDHGVAPPPRWPTPLTSSSTGPSRPGALAPR
jgi:hypothetical protein